MKFRWIGRLDRQQKSVRLGSFLWGTHPADAGHRNRLSASIRPTLFHFHREVDGWFVTVAGVQLHMKRHPRGVLV